MLVHFPSSIVILKVVVANMPSQCDPAIESNDGKGTVFIWTIVFPQVFFLVHVPGQFYITIDSLTTASTLDRLVARLWLSHAVIETSKAFLGFSLSINYLRWVRRLSMLGLGIWQGQLCFSVISAELSCSDGILMRASKGSFC